MLLYLVLLVIAAALIRHYWQLLKYAWQYVCMQVSVRLFHYRKQTVADLFAARVRATPHAPALIFEGHVYTFAALDRLSSRVAHWGLSQGLKPRQVIALLMENRLEFIVVWLGMAKIGVTSALINTNLRGASLSHSLRACETSLVVMGDECREAFEGVRSEFGPHLRIWIMDQTSANSPTGLSTSVNVDMNHNTGSSAFEFTPASTPSSPASPSSLTAPSISSPSSPQYENLSAALASIRDVSTDFATIRTSAHMNSSDLLFYIYTSGTTGMPKAAMIKHLRFCLTAASFVNFFGIHQADRIYCALPMYHSAGGMIGVSCSWYVGCSVILRRKFSARNFFQDCSEQQATIVQYIGQLARYLLATPPNSDFDTNHNVRMAIGNGLSEDIWDGFKARFHIPTIGEFYASTEGNANLVNNLNIKGVIGWIPPVAKLIYPIRIVRFDTREEKPLRNEQTGFCVECEPNEVGELLSKIDARDPLRHFDGYTSARATSDKILSNVFASGDRWFRSGDLVKADAAGLIRFVDRVGDTFRWKGENVATTEVGAIMSVFVPSRGTIIREVNVYGVFVAGNEGRAGMASISLETAATTVNGTNTDFSESEFDFQGFYSYLQSQLPSYQNPLFLRFQKEMEITSTFKHRKADLVTEGFDPRTIRDPLFFRDDAQKKYVRLDANLYEAIQKGKVRL